MEQDACLFSSYLMSLLKERAVLMQASDSLFQICIWLKQRPNEPQTSRP